MMLKCISLPASAGFVTHIEDESISNVAFAPLTLEQSCKPLAIAIRREDFQIHYLVHLNPVIEGAHRFAFVDAKHFQIIDARLDHDWSLIFSTEDILMIGDETTKNLDLFYENLIAQKGALINYLTQKGVI